MKNIQPLETPKDAARRLTKEAIQNGFEPEALHEYTDENNHSLFWCIRLKNPTTGLKHIRPMKLNGVGYTLGLPDFPNGKPLYKSYDLAICPTSPVIIVEGEKCVDALFKFDVLATTSGGADSADQANWELLASRLVILWPDNDDAGQRYMSAVEAQLKHLNCTVKTIDISLLNLPEKGDVVDWLAANPNTTKEHIEALICIKNDIESQDWPDPKTIDAPLHQVPIFNAEELLPDAIKSFVVDEAQRMPCSIDFIAVGVLIALGSLIGTRCAVKPKSRDSWLVIPNLWGAIVGSPSSKKSPSMGAALNPLDYLIKKASKRHAADIKDYKTKKLISDLKEEVIRSEMKKAAKQNNDEEVNNLAKQLQMYDTSPNQSPTMHRYKTNDTTIEKLGELLQENPNGLLVIRDELVGLMTSWDKEGREGDRAFYLESWNGNATFNTDRIGRGSITIPNLCVSIFGGIQPDKLITYLERATRSLANDGLLQRFQLLVYPDQQVWEWKDKSPDNLAHARAFCLFEELENFDPTHYGAFPADNSTKFPYLRFDEAAQEIFIEWSIKLHKIKLPMENNPIIEQHLAKYNKLFPALALIFQLIDNVENKSKNQIEAQAAKRAAAWCEYLEHHARRCYGLLTDSGLRAAQELAEKLKQSKMSEGFTARDVRRNQWRYLTDDESVQAALDWLEDENWLRSTEVGKSGFGRRTTRYFINPKISE